VRRDVGWKRGGVGLRRGGVDFSVGWGMTKGGSILVKEGKGRKNEARKQ